MPGGGTWRWGGRDSRETDCRPRRLSSRPHELVSARDPDKTGQYDGAVDGEISAQAGVSKVYVVVRYRGHVIYGCNPVTVGPEALGFASSQLPEEYWFAPDATIGVRSLSGLLGVQEF